MVLPVLAHNDRSVTWDGDEPVFTLDKGDVTAQVVVRPRTTYSIKSAVENSILCTDGVHSIGAGIRGRLGRSGLGPFRWLER